MIILLVILTVAFLAYYVMKPKSASDTECGAAIKKQQTRRVDKEGIDSNFKFEIANEKHFRSVSSNYCSIDKSVRADNLWVKSGESIQVHGLTIPGGMLYLGKGLGAVKEPYGLEPALINPTLAVNMASPDIEGTSFGYWPSYDGIPPEARAAYLLWLAGGRSDPELPPV